MGTDFHLMIATDLKRIPYAPGLASQKVFVITGEAGGNKMVDSLNLYTARKRVSVN